MDCIYDKRLKIDTSPVGPDEFRVLGKYKDSNEYVPTPYLVLKRLLKYVNKNDIFIDLGCGKGRVVCFIAPYVKKAIGVELSKELSEIAKANIKSPNIEIFNCDAANFDITEGSIYFLYGSFGYNSSEKVIENIKQSLIKNPRTITIIMYGAHFPQLLNWAKSYKEKRCLTIYKYQKIPDSTRP